MWQNFGDVGDITPAGQLLAVQSPISGHTLVVPPAGAGTAARLLPRVRDPISGVTLCLKSGAAEVTASMTRQPLKRARNVYVRRWAPGRDWVSLPSAVRLQQDPAAPARGEGGGRECPMPHSPPRLSKQPPIP